LVANIETIESIELAVRSHVEEETIKLITRNYNAMLITNRVVYGISSILIAFVLFASIRKQKQQVASHTVIMKLCALASSVVAFLWFVVDPFGYYRGIASFWFPSLLFKIHCGLFVIVYALILRIWVKASCRAIRLAYVKILPFLIYPCIGVMTVVSIYSGIFWYYPAANLAHIYAMMIVMVVCSIGYIVFGKNIVSILRNSGNKSVGSEAISKRIIVFIVGYTITCYTSHVTLIVGTLGEVFGTLFFFFVNCIGFLVIFLVLFFHPIERRSSTQKQGEPKIEMEDSRRSSTDQMLTMKVDASSPPPPQWGMWTSIFSFKQNLTDECMGCFRGKV